MAPFISFLPGQFLNEHKINVFCHLIKRHNNKDFIKFIFTLLRSMYLALTTGMKQHGQYTKDERLNNSTDDK